MRGWWLAAALLGGAQAALAQGAAEMSGIDFVVGFREMKGREVAISDCVVGGTTAEWIRCETGNGSASYTLTTATMDRASLRVALTNCPTGSAKKPGCKFAVTGVVDDWPMPRLSRSRLIAAK